MHEFSICQSLVAVVLTELAKIKRRRVRLKKANIIAGCYHRLNPASLKSAYKILTGDTAAKGSLLKIKTVPLKLKCNRCGWKGATRNIIFYCRKCGKTGVEITGGRELFLESIEIEPAKRR